MAAVCRGLGVIECKINVESCDVGTADNNKWRMKPSVKNNSSSSELCSLNSFKNYAMAFSYMLLS